MGKLVDVMSHGFKRAKAAADKVHFSQAARTAEKLRNIGESHEVLADHADTVAKATRIAATVAVAGAALAAPTGLTAIGVSLGIVSAPIVLSAAPVLVAVAGGALAVSAAASLYSKSRKRRAAMPSKPGSAFETAASSAAIAVSPSAEHVSETP